MDEGDEVVAVAKLAEKDDDENGEAAADSGGEDSESGNGEPGPGSGNGEPGDGDL